MNRLLNGGLLVLLLLATWVAAQACAPGTAKEINGNWYCSPVQAITYTNFPGFGHYNKVTNMDASTGQCTQQRYEYSGSLAPLNEELSLHVRGPTWLKQLALYVPGKSHTKRGSKANFHNRRHSHQHLHQRNGSIKDLHERKLVARAVDDIVTATIDGQVVSWTNVYAGPDAATPVTAKTTSPLPAPVNIHTPTDAPASSVVPDKNSNDPVDSWTRQAYYSAAGGISDGFTFLNHFGGTNGIPGTAEGGIPFGASLSYASSDGKSGAASAQVLSNAMIEDNVEVVILSNKSCDDGGCGYTRPGGVAYHGFGGDHKVFLLEFSMPSTGQHGLNGDMPAIWLNNAQIPLTSQYGTNPNCSCWSSGCGEFDLFEILDPGNTRCKSTLHMAPAGGSSDYFLRPTEGAITAAVVFTGRLEVAHIQILDGHVSFDPVLATDVVDGFTSLQGESPGSSQFVLGP